MKFVKITGYVLYCLWIILTVVISVLGIVAVFSKMVRPSELSPFFFLSLIEPFLIAANILLLFVWLAMWKPWVIFPLLACVLSFGHIDSYFSVRLSKQYDLKPAKEKKSLKVMTYNVKGFNGSLEYADSVISVIENFSPDILCLVEYASLSDKCAEMFSSRLKKLSYYVSRQGIVKNLSSQNGIVLFSRFPILNAQHYNYENSETAVIADAFLDYGDTVRLVAVHLYSSGYNKISHEQPVVNYISDDVIEKKNLMSSIKNNRTILQNRLDTLLITLSQNAYHRSYQADTIRTQIDSSPYKTIVLGDFNDTPYSYSVKTIQGDDHLDCFCEFPSNNYGYTFNKIRKLFRIDFILPDKSKYEVVDYLSPNLPYSDHNPVMVKLRNR